MKRKGRECGQMLGCQECIRVDGQLYYAFYLCTSHYVLLCFAQAQGKSSINTRECLIVSAAVSIVSPTALFVLSCLGVFVVPLTVL